MDPNRIKGVGKEIKGEVKDTVGKVTGNKQQQIEGKIDKGVGKVQDTYGRAKDELKDQIRHHQDRQGRSERMGDRRDDRPELDL